MFEDITLHLGIATTVAMLVAKSTKHLHRGVSLLGRRGLVVQKNLVDDPLEWPELRRGTIPNRRGRLGLVESLPDGNSREIEFPGKLPDGFATAVCPPNGAIIIHRKHVLDPPCGETSMQGSSPYRRDAAVGHF